ncbi:K+-transporting ATPase ATPase B chain [Isoptericola sp. CG 20/1183]|uniref:Potassium-transporting ATPase ATP-binding subunit n=1 Tax=Isoptericola halotolerans TaxID=300560 RepID=A0ABX5EJP1_9MICO|nr:MULTISPECIES: potassium-transporting ATPase subunit KdpB [Isoptericola]PRZ02934.1 K+-transporting ATPase ATPase B chain [Isoptericola sp. CG 20/1183]PRZ09931.1 K+-transporting ATPase ATPase B chain [Isoptericola halotolerans]
MTHHTTLTPPQPSTRPSGTTASAPLRGARQRSVTWAQVRAALPGALRGMDPRTLRHSPVLLVVEGGAVLTTVLAAASPSLFSWLVTLWLWATVFFATLAESIAEARGRAQASSLRATQRTTTARKVVAPRDTLASGTSLGELPAVEVASADLTVGDVVVVVAGETIPGDGDVIEGVATVDESAITGESAPVIRESGGDRCAVTGGTVVLSDRIVVRITNPPGQSFVDRMIALVEGSERQRTPNEVALNLLLTALTAVFVLAVATLQPFAVYSGARQDVIVLVALLVCLIPTTIGALLSAIGIAGMDRLVQRNVLAMSGRAVEAAGDVDVLLLDKTGTITYGNRRATDLLPVGDAGEAELAAAARLASLADDTPEGRSIVELVDHRSDAPAGELPAGSELVPFTAQTRMSGVDLPGTPGEGAVRLRKGAASAVQRWLRSTAAQPTAETLDELSRQVDSVARTGGTPLVVAQQLGDAPARVLGVVHLKDVVKDGVRERFDELRAMGIRTVMVTGDNAVTARAIAAEAGVDDVLAEATPEDKLALIRREQEGGRLVAMAGDGTNDAPALAQSDVGVAMASGTSAAKEAGNMVDLDSDPTKLIEIVEVGKQLLITRGALTTFSVANDVAKYFAILPAMFVGFFPQLGLLNVMGLHSPESAIVSAVIFNALVILALVPLALRGVRYRPSSASALLRRNLCVYGLGGLVAPFLGIKLIDLAVSLLPGL